MSRAIVVLALLPCLPLLAACAGSSPPELDAAGAPAAAGPVAEVAAAAPGDAEAAAFREALERAVAAAAGPDDLHLFTECRRDGGLESVEVFGSGVGIWQERGQFRIGGADRARLLAALVEFDYAGMPESFGGKGTGETGIRSRPDGGAADAEGDEGFALRVICRIEATVDGQTKMVVQFDKGYISRELLELAAKLLGISEKLAQEVVKAESLADGLEKVASGSLAPETFELLLHRKPERQGTPGDGFLLRIDSGRVTSRPWSSGGGYGTPRELSLTAEELAELARAIRSADPDELPINLYSPIYTDLSLSVLDREATLQARQFAEMTETTHGERQRAFDRLYETLERLHQRVLAQGEMVAETG